VGINPALASSSSGFEAIPFIPYSPYAKNFFLSNRGVREMITVLAKKISDAKAKTQALVVFVHKTGSNWSASGLGKDDIGRLRSYFGEDIQFIDMKKGLFLRKVPCEGHDHTIVVGIESTATEDLRKAATAAAQVAQTNKISEVSVHLATLGKSIKDLAEATHALTEGFGLSTYRYDRFLSKPKENDTKKKLEVVHLLVSGKMNLSMAAKGVGSGLVMTECVNFARSLGDAPGNVITPVTLAEEARSAAKGSGLKVTIWDKARIKKERFGGLYGVNLGGGPDCRFIYMEYQGAGKSKRPVAFVGKGLTFDSGGISIKPSGGMEEMKYDMCGGAAVIATMLAIAKLKLKINAIGLVPATENMSGPMANKPGDILIARNGKTVEVFNTDAEGRLILMDALVYACEQKPAAVFDAATLTGAIVVALGNSYTGVFSRDKKLLKIIQDAADQAGEPIWPMPINDDHLADMKGTHADLCNISSFKGAGSSTAAAFLEQFVEKDIPWAHFDIAGTAWNIGNRVPYCPKKGASGVMVRTFVELAKKFGS